MKSSQRTWAGLLLALILLGLGLGRLVLLQSRQISDLAALDQETRKRTQDLQRERDELQQQPTETPPPESAPTLPRSEPPVPIAIASAAEVADPAPPQPPFVAISTAMPELSRGPLLRTPQWTGWEEDGAHLTDDFVQLFRLTQEETKTIELALTDAARQLTAFALAHASYEEGSVFSRVTIEPFAGGDAVWSDFVQRLANTLGADRYELFQNHYGGNSGGDAVFMALGNFGLRQRTIGIRKVNDSYMLMDQKFGNGIAITIPRQENPETPRRLQDLRLRADVRQLLTPFASRIRDSFGEPLFKP